MKHSGGGFRIYNKKRKEFGNEKRNLILEIILESKEGLELNQILNILKKKIEEKLENYKIEIANEFTVYNEYRNKLNERKKELTIGERMVLYYLRDLKQNHMIEKRDKKYFPSLYVLNNQYKFMPSPFGKSMVYSIGYFNPENLEKSLIEYIIRYGLFIIYTFMEYSKIRAKAVSEKEYKKNLLYDWLQKSIPLKEMYKIFTDLYFKVEVDKVQLDKDKLISKMECLLKKNYPVHYELLREIRNTHIRRIEKSKNIQNIEEAKLKRFQNQVDHQMLNNNDAKVDEVKIESINNIARGRVVPKNWYEQLAKESE
ncbi:MAG: hypothetical protein K0S93_850 [Nitrososphaeraceae archaeon]|jgi:hypothetical protein|nr:hypothetical protein [Nitrososphaeraceae archaeon]